MPLATIMMTFLHKMGTYFQPSFATYEPELFGNNAHRFQETIFTILRGLSQMTSAPKGGGGVSEMLTKPDIGGGEV